MELAWRGELDEVPARLWTYGVSDAQLLEVRVLGAEATRAWLRVWAPRLASAGGGWTWRVLDVGSWLRLTVPASCGPLRPWLLAMADA